MSTEIMEHIKSVCFESERLFRKLHRTADSYRNIELDESGMYVEAHDTAKRHHKTLRDKVYQAIAGVLDDVTVKAIVSKDPGECELKFKLVTRSEDAAEETLLYTIDYSDPDELKIFTQAV
jgi:hypothetical protein